jgi:hypothetical protein
MIFFSTLNKSKVSCIITKESPMKKLHLFAVALFTILSSSPLSAQVEISSDLKVQSGSVRSKSPAVIGGTYTVLAGDQWLIVDNGTTSTITLPDASTCPGRSITIKSIVPFAVNSASNNIGALGTDGSTLGNSILTGSGKWATLVALYDNSLSKYYWVIMSAN